MVLRCLRVFKRFPKKWRNKWNNLMPKRERIAIKNYFWIALTITPFIIDPFCGSDDESGKQFMFKRQDITAEVFAGGNVVAEFIEEKKRVADDEDDKE